MKKLLLLLLLAPLFSQGQIITTIAGNNIEGDAGDGGPATAAELNIPVGIARDHHGNLFVSEFFGNAIRKITPTGVISTIAGSGVAGYSGDGGPATAATLDNPEGLAIDKYDNVYVADNGNNVVRKIDTNGIITTYAGNGTGAGAIFVIIGGYTGDGGPADSAQLSSPTAICFDAHNDLYIADQFNNVIRKVDTAGIITTFAGDGYLAGTFLGGYTGDGGPADSATLFFPSAVAFDATGNCYLSDADNDVVRRVDPLGIITTFAGDGAGSPTGGGGYAGDGGPATAAELFQPEFGLACDDSGHVYISDIDNNVVRVVNAGDTINTYAGTGTGFYSGDGGPATAAMLSGPAGLVLDSAGNLYIADAGNNVVRMVSGISGAQYICTGDSVLFTDNMPGGAWYSLAPAVATVSATGMVVGLSSGNAVICYVAGTDTAKAPVTVNAVPNPGVITGTDSICLGSVGTLSDSVPGGVWSTPDTAGVEVVAGLYEGLAGGLDTVYYTVHYTCGDSAAAIYLYFVDNYPGDILGPDSLCPGDTVTYTETVTGGVWGIDDTFHLHLIGPGTVVGVLPGEDFIFYDKSGPVPDCDRARYRTVEVKTLAECTAGLPEIAAGVADVRLYPNPANSRLTLSSSAVIRSVTVDDVTGKQLIQRTFAERTVDIDVADLAAGVYLLRVNGSVVRRFVKQ